MQYAYIQFWNKEHEKALLTFRKAFHLDPYPSNTAYVQRGETYYALKRYNDAKNDFLKALSIQQNDIFAYIGLIATYQMLGKKDKVESQIKELYKIDPNYRLTKFKDPVSAILGGDVLFYEALKEAGLPD